MSELEV